MMKVEQRLICIIAPAHSIPFFLSISALPNELNEEKKRIDGQWAPKRMNEQQENKIYFIWLARFHFSRREDSRKEEWKWIARQLNWWSWWVMSCRSSAAGQRRSSNSWIAFALRPLPSAFELIKRRRAAGRMVCEWSGMNWLERLFMNLWMNKADQWMKRNGGARSEAGRPRPFRSKSMKSKMNWIAEELTALAAQAHNLLFSSRKEMENRLSSSAININQLSSFNSNKKVCLIEKRIELISWFAEGRDIITVIGRYKDSMHVVTIFNTRSN